MAGELVERLGILGLHGVVLAGEPVVLAGHLVVASDVMVVLVHGEFGGVCSFGGIGRHDRLKICFFLSIGSNPITSNFFLHFL